MRPDAPDDPCLELEEEPTHVGFAVVLPPPANDRIDLLDELRGRDWRLSAGHRADLVLEAADRLLSRVRIERARLCPAPDLLRRQPKLSTALDLEAEELEAVSDADDPRLPRVHTHAECLKDLSRRLERGARLRCRRAGDYPIVGIPRQLIAPPAHLPVERRQEDVAEEGRDHPALRCPSVGRKEPASVVSPGFEHCLHEAQHSAIAHALGYERDELFVIDGPEEVLQIRIHDPLTTALDLLPDFAKGVLRRSSSPVSEVGVVEYWLEDRLQPVHKRLLAHAIEDRRDAKRSMFASAADLWDPDRTNGLRTILVGFESPLKVREPQLVLRLEHLHTLAVDPTAALVCADLLPGDLQVLPLAYLVDDRVLLPRTRWVEPVGESPWPRMYGSFAQGTVPPPWPCSSRVLAPSNRLRRPPSPAHSGRRSRGRAAFTALLVLLGRPTTRVALLPISLTLIGSLPPEPPGNHVSPPEVTR